MVLHHLFGMEDLVEFLGGEEAEGDTCLLEADILIERLVCGLGGVLVADVWVQRRDEHERAMEILVHLLAVRRDSRDATVVERLDRVGEEACGLEEVIDHDRHEDVQLEIALRGRKADRSVVAHDLHGDHRDGLALRRVDLARHDGAARFVRGNRDFAETAARTCCEPADVVCDLHHVRGESLESAVRKDNCVLARECVELVRRSDKLLARQLACRLGDGDIESLRRVQSRADSSAAECELMQERQSCLQLLLRLLKHGEPAADLLREGDGNGILQMCTSGLDNALILLHEAAEGTCEEINAREEPVLDGDDGGDVHCCRESVVRALRHVGVIVRMEDFLARDLVSAVRDDLVDVHVGLCAAARLPDGEREVFREFACDDLVARRLDGVQTLFVELAELVVRDGSGFLQNAERVNDLGGHLFDSDGEILKAAFRLRRPILVCGHLDFAEGIVFDTILHLDCPPFYTKKKNLLIGV